MKCQHGVLASMQGCRTLTDVPHRQAQDGQAAADMLDTVITGDAIERLSDRPEGSVHCCVTSPPYWNLRDYKVPPRDWPEVTFTPMAGFPPMTIPPQTAVYGLEPDPWSFIAHGVLIFRAVRRVLRDDGTLWLNIGDTYASGKAKQSYVGDMGDDLGWSNRQSRIPPPGLKVKDLVGIPWMLAFALRADGWYLRSDIIWHKPNPMPESTRDRPTKAHEYLFLLTKKPRYFYDQDAIREPQSELTLSKATGAPRRVGVKQSGIAGSGTTLANGDYKTPGWIIPGGRNKRTVWTVPTFGYPQAHFATFPPRLIEPCILAGTSAKGCCGVCGAPWVRVVERSKTFESGSGKSGNAIAGKHGPECQGGGDTGDIRKGPSVSSITTGWQPTCDHIDAETVPCTVLDPFAGSGTTGQVAREHGRHYLLVELNAQYVQQIRQRLDSVQPPLWPAEAAEGGTAE